MHICRQTKSGHVLSGPSLPRHGNQLLQAISYWTRQMQSFALLSAFNCSPPRGRISPVDTSIVLTANVPKARDGCSRQFSNSTNHGAFVNSIMGLAVSPPNHDIRMLTLRDSCKTIWSHHCKSRRLEEKGDCTLLGSNWLPNFWEPLWLPIWHPAFGKGVRLSEIRQC